MRVALNMLFVAPGVAGGSVYCEELLRGLASADSQTEYACFTRRDTQLPILSPERFLQVRAPVSDKSVLWRTAWEYGLLPGRLRRGRFSLLHGLGSVSPSVKSCPFVVTMHDLIPFHFPQSSPLGHRLFFRWALPSTARHAARIIVPSRWVANDVRDRLGVPEERLRVVPYGPGQGFTPVAEHDRLEETWRRHGVRPPYVISVCRGYQHKNLIGLVRAFAHLRKQGDRAVQLVLVGQRYQTGGEVDRLAQRLGLAGEIVSTGYVTQDDLNALYSGATVFAFPSLAEGLGLPVLEAMACGAPVVASNATAIPEGVGTAGLLADARDPEAFACAIAQVLNDANLRTTLRTAGLARVREFSWDLCARQTLSVYREFA